MKLRLLSLGLISVAAAQVVRAKTDDTVSHSFFSVRAPFQTGSPERDALWRIPLMDARQDGHGGSVEVVGFYSQSTQSADLGKFFMPFGGNVVNVEEFKIPVSDNVNPQLLPNSDLDRPQKKVEARHFNIQTIAQDSNYQGTISFCPEQKVGGIGFGYRQILWRDCENDCPRLWAEVTFPVVHVENKINLKEKVNSNGGGAASDIIGLSNSPRVGTMTDAFKQTNMLYGKVDDKKCLKKWGVADVEFKLGWSTIWSDCCKLNGYIGFVAPTGNKVDKKVAAYIFSPVIGNNKHWAFTIGNYADIDIWSRHNHDVRLVYTLQSKILFKNNQWRSFDLVQKQWGRYMEIYSSETAAQAASDDDNPNVGTFGINAFTQCVEVSPRYEVTSTAAFQWYHCNWSGELGYNFFARHKENIKLCNWKESVALKAVDGQGLTQQARTIGKNFRGVNVDVANYGYTVITKADLDLDAAAHPGVLSNIVYGALGYEWDVCDFPQRFSIGGSYEFTTVNTAINRWMVWGKWNMSF